MTDVMSHCDRCQFITLIASIFVYLRYKNVHAQQDVLYSIVIMNAERDRARMPRARPTPAP